MTVPAFAPNGVLPPFLGRPTDPASRSPYRTSLVEVVRALGTSSQRRTILRGLLRYRAELARVGVADGFQWLDGSFAERLAREPGDVDVVTFARVAPLAVSLVPADRALFDPTKTKATFHCDAYFVSLTSPKVVDRTTYYYGLFSHRRGTFEWKGMLQIALDASIAGDVDAQLELDLLDVEEELTS